MATKRNGAVIKYSDDYWGSVRLLVRKFFKRYRDLIPRCLSEEDFYQEAWLARNGYINRYPWQACLRLVEKHSPYSSHELKKWKKGNPLPKRKMVGINKIEFEGLEGRADTITTLVELQYLFAMMDKTGIRHFRAIFISYNEGAETNEIAEKFGLGRDRTRHIRSDGLKILRKLLKEEGYGPRSKSNRTDP